MRTTRGQTVRIYTSAGTRWHGCGWREVHAGYRMEVHAYRSNGRWMATQMEAWHGEHRPAGDHHDGDHMMGGYHPGGYARA